MVQIHTERWDVVCKYREGADYRLAPLHLLRSEGVVHGDKTNRGHMETHHRLAACDPAFLLATRFLELEVTSDAGIQVDGSVDRTGRRGLKSQAC